MQDGERGAQLGSSAEVLNKSICPRLEDGVAQSHPNFLYPAGADSCQNGRLSIGAVGPSLHNLPCCVLTEF